MNIKSKKDIFFSKEIYTPNKKEFLIISVILGITAYLSLIIFPTIGLFKYNFDGKQFYLAGLGLLESIVFLIFFALPIVLLRRGEGNSKYKVWEFVVLFTIKISIMAICLDLYNNSWFPSYYRYNILVRFPAQIGNVLTVGLFPFTMLALWFIYKSYIPKLSSSNQDATDVDSLIIVRRAKKGSDIKIKVSDILYIKSDRNYLDINYLEDSIEKRVVHRGSLSSMIDQLPEGLFCRIHNSYLVRLSLISAPYTVNSTYVVRLASPEEVTLPVSRTYLKAVREALTK